MYQPSVVIGIMFLDLAQQGKGNSGKVQLRAICQVPLKNSLARRKPGVVLGVDANNEDKTTGSNKEATQAADVLKVLVLFEFKLGPKLQAISLHKPEKGARKRENLGKGTKAGNSLNKPRKEYAGGDGFIVKPVCCRGCCATRCTVERRQLPRTNVLRPNDPELFNLISASVDLEGTVLPNRKLVHVEKMTIGVIIYVGSGMVSVSTAEFEEILGNMNENELEAWATGNVVSADDFSDDETEGNENRSLDRGC